eukprot:40167-Pyramimonas_sp.AAC.1
MSLARIGAAPAKSTGCTRRPRRPARVQRLAGFDRSSRFLQQPGPQRGTALPRGVAPKHHLQCKSMGHLKAVTRPILRSLIAG